MPSLTKREMKKIVTRLEFIFEKLDGKEKARPKLDGPQDEFSYLQIHISEQIIMIRNKIEQQRNAEKKKDEYINSIKLKNELKTDIIELENLMDKLRTILDSLLKSEKVTQKVKDDRIVILNKFVEIVDQLSRAIAGEQIDITPYRKPAVKLRDLQNEYSDKKILDANPKFGEDNPEDELVLGQWAEKDRRLEDKLEDVNKLLDEIKLMNQNLAGEIVVRDELIDDTHKDAKKTNKEIAQQNKTLADILKKYRAPGKICLDICLFILLLGLISVIIMLAINGKL